MNGDRWRERARAIAEELIVPVANRIDREHSIPPEIVRRMAGEGLFGLAIPKEFGGSAASARDIAAVVEEISFGSLSVATDLAVHLSVASAPIAQWGTPEQKQRWLPAMARGEWLGAFALTEPGAGSDAQHLTTRYTSSPEGFRIDGAKTFITNGGQARVVLVFATRDPGLEARGISCFLVEHGTPGFTVARTLEKLGLMGSETTELHFEDCRVDRTSLLGPEGQGFRIAMSSLEGGRIGISASSLGVARAALKVLRESVRTDSEEWARAALARAHVEVEAAGALVERAATQKDAGVDYGLAASAAKLFASQAAFRVASKALELVLQGNADENARATAKRLFRDSRVLAIVEGATEIQELILGRRLASPPRAD